jgi:Bcr/CflA subfamily drug resistance transporter
MHATLVQPPLWLIFTLVGLPQFSETVYSPALPDIAHALATSVAMVEYTLTIYLFAFSFGMLFWGKISDYWGRKPSMLMGLSMYVVGCIGCYYSSSITLLMISRFIQAFGGSAGSVVGQAICRDVFQGKALSRVYAAMSSALGVPPAVGPIVGGFIAEQWGWAAIFVLLTFVGSLVVGCTARLLPETLPNTERRSFALGDIVWRLVSDKKVMAYAWLIGCANGVMFSYFSEGAFYLIELLGLSPTAYGMSFIFISCAMMSGGWLASWLHHRYEVHDVLRWGTLMMLTSTGLFSLVVLCCPLTFSTKFLLLCVALGSHMVSMAGRCLVNSSALSVALDHYRWCGGTASSVFGFMYYLVVSLITLGIGLLHNGTAYPMPLYFCVLAISMVVVNRTWLKD